MSKVEFLGGKGLDGSLDCPSIKPSLAIEAALKALLAGVDGLFQLNSFLVARLLEDVECLFIMSSILLLLLGLSPLVYLAITESTSSPPLPESICICAPLPCICFQFFL